MTTKTVRLYIGESSRVAPRIHVSQFDTAWELYFDLVYSNQPWNIPASSTARFSGRKPDGNVFVYDAEIENNQIVVDLSDKEQVTIVSGNVECELTVIESTGEEISTVNFVLVVEESPVGSDLPSESELPGLYGEIRNEVYAAADKAFIKRTASGTVASFDDGGDDLPVKALTVNIDPVQEGSGDPYPAGGGTNKLPPFVVGTQTKNGVTVTVNANQTISVKGTLTDYTSFSIALGQPVTMVDGQYIHYRNTVSGIGEISFGDSQLAYTDLGAAGRIVGVQDTREIDAMNIALLSDSGSVDFTLHVSLEDTNTTTDWTPYENIRPISGWTGAKVTRCGKNVFPLLPTRTVTRHGLTIEFYVDGTFAVNGTATRDSNFGLLTEDDFPFSYNGDICVSGCPVGGSPSTYYLDYYFTPIAGSSRTLKDYGSGATTNFSNFKFIYARCFFVYKNGTVFNNAVFKPQIEIGSTVTAFEPCNSDVHNITFPTSADTVYGGTLDVANGVLTVDRAFVDLGSLTWDKLGTAVSGKYLFRASGTGVKNADSSGSIAPNILCSAYKAITPNATWSATLTGITSNIGNNELLLHDPAFYNSDAEAFKAAMSGVQAVFELASPLAPIQLTPQEVKTLLGINNIFADTGDTTVTYRADPSIVIQNIINAVNGNT